MPKRTRQAGLVISLTLLIAFLHCYFEEIFPPDPGNDGSMLHGDDDAANGPLSIWCLYGFLRPSAGLGESRNQAQSNTSVPKPDHWRWTTHSTTSEPEESACGWPSAMNLHLFCSLYLLSIVICMWFYSLHLKLFGHS